MLQQLCVCKSVNGFCFARFAVYVYVLKKKKKTDLGIFRGVARDFKKTKYRAKPPYDN